MAEKVLIAPVSVDFLDSSGDLYRRTVPEVDGGVSVHESSLALDALATIVALKKQRQSPDTAFDLNHPQTAQLLRSDRRHALDLTRYLSTDIRQTLPDSSVAIYGYADLHALGNRDTNTVFRSRVVGDDLLVRAEEGLTVRADALIEQVKRRLEHEPYPGVELQGNDIVRTTRQGGTSRLPLRGYTYNRSGNSDNPRQEFPDFPSCEAFLAAAALEQIEIADTVVRLVPSSMKDREYSARLLLQIAGHNDLPVLSAAISETGDVQKIIPWTEAKEEGFETVRASLRSREAHVASRQYAKFLHDALFAEHKQSYQKYSFAEATANVPPSGILQYEFLTERAQEFLGRILRSAPMYEDYKAHADPRKVSLALRTLAGIFSQQYDPNLKAPQLKHRPLVERYNRGYGSNDIVYSRLLVARRPETQIIEMPEAKEVCLIVHAVHEHGNEALERALREANGKVVDIADLFEKYPPRYVLIEANRLGKGLKPYWNI